MAAEPGRRPCWLKNLSDSLTIFRYFKSPPANPPEEEIRLSLLLMFDIERPIPAASDEYVEISLIVFKRPSLESESL